MCCGSGTRAARGPVIDTIEYVEAIYSPPPGQSGEASLYSQTKMDPTTRRRLLISAAASPGDIVMVPMSDVLANPALYRSTCGEAWIRRGNSIVDPCANRIPTPAVPDDEVAFVDDSDAAQAAKYGVPESVISWEDAEDSLREVFGPLATGRIIKVIGYVTPEQIFGMGNDVLTEKLGKRIAGIIEKRGPVE